MKRSGLILVTIIWLFYCLDIQASGLFCTVDDSGEQAKFICLDPHRQIAVNHMIDHLHRFDFSNFLTEQGVEMLEPSAYLARSLAFNLQEFQLLGVLDSCPEDGEGETLPAYYRPNQVEMIKENKQVIGNLKKLATALREAGVCKLKLPTGRARNIRQINIQSKDDILQHFLCITNSESVFGTRNIGMGGRGPFGINPIHTLKNGRCDRPMAKRAILRDARGGEIKDSKRYITDGAILQHNTRCAFILYEEANYFESWGNDQVSWGSNRHCSARVRKALNFPALIGDLACCSKECKSKKPGSV